MPLFRKLVWTSARSAALAAALALTCSPGSAAPPDITVSSNFVPTVNGFSFRNYSNSPGNYLGFPVQKFEDSDVFRLFGSRACLQPKGATVANCVPTPIMNEWRDEAGLREGAAGNCFGFAALAQRLFGGEESAAQIDPAFASIPNTYDIPIKPISQTQALQHEIYYWWATQLGVDIDTDYQLSPTRMVEVLQAAFGGNPNQSPYILATYNHAVTPIGVVPTGEPGVFNIQMYDNNWPGVVRTAVVDTNHDTFFYNGKDETQSSIYDEQGEDARLYLVPITAIANANCATLGLCSDPSQPNSESSTSVFVKGARPISVRIVSLRNKALKDAVVRAPDPSLTNQAIIEVPSKHKRFVAVIKNLDKRKHQTVSLGAFSDGRAIVANNMKIGAGKRFGSESTTWSAKWQSAGRLTLTSPTSQPRVHTTTKSRPT